MSKCIIVLSIGRSGSSAVAGMLHELGVDMGAKFLDGDRNNPLGTFEDIGFVNLNRAILTGKADVSELAGMVRDEPLWGVKDPQLCLTVGHLLPHLYEAGVDVRIVHVVRNPDKVIDSFNRAYLDGTNVAKKWYDVTADAIEKNLARYDGPLLTVFWEDVLANPHKVAAELAAFTGTLDVHDNSHVDRAAEMIKPKSTQNGFGELALGVRIAKFPEPEFFTSWTALLTGGVRSTDTVLLPQSYMPAHKAANALARDFLLTDKDSLFLVDDDMAFDQGALEKLRSNPDTYDYDIVFGLCTHRTYPPRPVIMRLEENQPDKPEILKGDSFIVPDFSDGDIVPVDAVGLAFTIIKRRVFEAMLDPDYGVDYTWFFDYGVGAESDDISFCRRARELGFTMAVDTNVKIQHIGQKKFDYTDYADLKNSIELDIGDIKPILKYAQQSKNGLGDIAEEILTSLEGAANE